MKLLRFPSTLGALALAAALAAGCSTATSVAPSRPVTSPSPAPAPSAAAPAGPSATASSFLLPGTALRLDWTPERPSQDWPGPIRPEPIPRGPVIQFVPGPDSIWETGAGRWQDVHYVDPVGDVGPDRGWLDIAKVGHGGSGPPYFCLHLAADLPNLVPDPATRWIAYGWVLDTNADGRADVRIGMDQTGAGRRAWRTDLATGETSGQIGPPYRSFGSTSNGDRVSRIVDWYFPSEDWDPGVAKLYYSADPGEPMPRAYAWASLIEDGRVVATDFAPDAGWLEEPPSPT